MIGDKHPIKNDGARAFLAFWGKEKPHRNEIASVGLFGETLVKGYNRADRVRVGERVQEARMRKPNMTGCSFLLVLSLGLLRLPVLLYHDFNVLRTV